MQINGRRADAFFIIDLWSRGYRLSYGLSCNRWSIAILSQDPARDSLHLKQAAVNDGFDIPLARRNASRVGGKFFKCLTFVMPNGSSLLTIPFPTFWIRIKSSSSQTVPSIDLAGRVLVIHGKFALVFRLFTRCISSRHLPSHSAMLTNFFRYIRTPLTSDLPLHHLFVLPSPHQGRSGLPLHTWKWFWIWWSGWSLRWGHIDNFAH